MTDCLRCRAVEELLRDIDNSGGTLPGETAIPPSLFRALVERRVVDLAEIVSLKVQLHERSLT